MNLLVKAKRDQAEIATVTPESAGWRYVGFSARRLPRGTAIVVGDALREFCVVILTGTVSVSIDEENRWSGIGGRRSVFDDQAPHAVYLPPGVGAVFTADVDAELGLCSAPATGKFPARLIEPAQMKRSVRGSGSNTRYVRDILPQTEAAESLLVVEVLTPGGHSSSYPPHKHDDDNVPSESALEETYYHRLNPAQGFAFQRVYTDARDLDESMAVEDHDVVMVPRGYHPVVVPHGYDSYYLNVMAGPTRVWHFHNDPAHEWLFTPNK
jgi:5-deoxy-glucuronate isomerase